MPVAKRPAYIWEKPKVGLFELLVCGLFILLTANTAYLIFNYAQLCPVCKCRIDRDRELNKSANNVLAPDLVQKSYAIMDSYAFVDLKQVNNKISIMAASESIPHGVLGGVDWDDSGDDSDDSRDDADPTRNKSTNYDNLPGNIAQVLHDFALYNDEDAVKGYVGLGSPQNLILNVHLSASRLYA